MYFTFVETHGYTLEEISTIFDGDEDFNAIAAAAADDKNEEANMGDVFHAEIKTEDFNVDAEKA